MSKLRKKVIFISWLQLRTAGRGHKRAVACRKARTCILRLRCSLDPCPATRKPVRTEQVQAGTSGACPPGWWQFSLPCWDNVCSNIGGSAIDVSHCCPGFYHQCVTLLPGFGHGCPQDNPRCRCHPIFSRHMPALEELWHTLVLQITQHCSWDFWISSKIHSTHDWRFSFSFFF